MIAYLLCFPQNNLDASVYTSTFLAYITSDLFSYFIIKIVLEVQDRQRQKHNT